MDQIETITCAYLGHSVKPQCCAPRVAGRSYCADHLWLVYQQGSNLRARHKDVRVANAVWDIQQAFQEAVEELEAEGYDMAEPQWAPAED